MLRRISIYTSSKNAVLLRSTVSVDLRIICIMPDKASYKNDKQWILNGHPTIKWKLNDLDLPRGGIQPLLESVLPSPCFFTEHKFSLILFKMITKHNLMMCQNGKICMFSSQILPKSAQNTGIYFSHLTITEPGVTCYKINCCLDN